MRVTFNGLYRGINKVAGTFNPKELNVTYTTPEGTLILAGAKQYERMDTAVLEFTIPRALTFEDGADSMNYVLSDGHISGNMYSASNPFNFMYTMTDLEPGSITGVFVDGKKLDSRYYTVSGSDVTLTADYLKTLRSGKHTVKIENAPKVATGSFTLSGSGAVQSSRTGDPGVVIYFAMGAVSFLGSAAWLRKRKET